jgi:hypothetical protein
MCKQNSLLGTCDGFDDIFLRKKTVSRSFLSEASTAPPLKLNRRLEHLGSMSSNATRFKVESLVVSLDERCW